MPKGADGVPESGRPLGLRPWLLFPWTAQQSRRRVPDVAGSESHVHIITAFTRGRIEARYTTESMTPTIPVKSQKSTISAIHIPFDDPAATNAPPGREMASISAQMGMTSDTRAITRMIKPSAPKISPVTPPPPAQM